MRLGYLMDNSEKVMKSPDKRIVDAIDRHRRASTVSVLNLGRC